MKVLVTGHNGYIGSVMVDVLARGGHEVTGLDTYLYEGCNFGPDRRSVPSIRKDVRDVDAGRSARLRRGHPPRRPVQRPPRLPGDDCTYDINHLARASAWPGRQGRRRAAVSVRLVLQPVRRRRRDDMLDEQAAFNPITAYGASKVLVEQDVAKLADDSFSPTYFRNATAYGASPRLRADIVVNNFVGVAYTTGEVLIQSDGTPWRPLVHIEDISRAFLRCSSPARSWFTTRHSTSAARRRTTRFATSRHRAGGRAGLHGQIRRGRRSRSALLSGQLRQDHRAHSRASGPSGRCGEASRRCTTAYARTA